MHTISNSKGTIWYGLHMYPGVAEYIDKKTKKPYRVCINEDAIRKMDRTFEGKPVYVRHAKGEIPSDREKLRKEADGWVIESFFNPSDGKHWAKIVTVTDQADQAIKNGWGFSNAYDPTEATKGGGEWNSITYKFEVLNGVYDHMAIVPNPRYEQTTILTPDQFKAYNARQVSEVKRIANSKDKKKREFNVKTKIQLFKRTKIENSADLEKTIVVLPTTGKEMSIAKLVNEHDKLLAKGDEDLHDQEVEVAGETMTVGELVEKHETLVNEIENADEDDDDDEDMENADEDDDDDEDMENEDDDEENKKKPDPKDKKENKKPKKNAKPEPKKNAKKNSKGRKSNSKSDEDDTGSTEEKRKAKEKADRLRNAKDRSTEPKHAESNLLHDGIARGKSRYGSD